MIRQPCLPLLAELRHAHLDGIYQYDLDHGLYTVYELAGEANDASDMAQLLERIWSHDDRVTVYLLDLDGIGYMGPSASSALVEGTIRFSRSRKRPVVLVGVRPEVLEGLRNCRYMNEHNPILWARGIDGGFTLVGKPPTRFTDILGMLAKEGTASASDLAEKDVGDLSKKSVNRYSVYLQELFNAGLVTREKVGGSERQDGDHGERGWTYVYRAAPSYLKTASTAKE